ncbi:MAG: B12-binding domain-containing radical SAM protein [Candidatus Sumerlaeota bacterium]
MQMELFNNQITRGQHIHSPRHNFWTFPLYFLAENIDVPATVLDFPSWREFTEELGRGYTHVGVSFIQTNVMKVRRMAEYVRAHFPDMQIILGGYGASLPDLEGLVPHDALCEGEGVRWMREYFGEDPGRDIVHPIMHGVAKKNIYGFSDIIDDSATLFPGLGCENACSFCSTSSKFGHAYIPFLETGQDVFDVCRLAEEELGVEDFAIIDENFLKNPERAEELLGLMEEYERPYTFASFSSAETIAELGVDFMARLGVILVWIGVESQAEIFGKQRNINIPQMISDLQANGISVISSSILFLPHHDAEQLESDIDWAVGLDSDFHQFMQLTPLPGTPLHEEYKERGDLLESFPYTRMSGQDSLMFTHPHFDGAEATRLTREAFRRKYQKGGPGVVRMARTVLNGYRKTSLDVERREQEGLVWHADALRYGPSNNGSHDAFMCRRVEKMKRRALEIRPILLAASLFGPNGGSRRMARQVASDYEAAFGKMPFIEKAKSAGAVATSMVEIGRTALARLRGREDLVRQPPTRRWRYERSR